MGDISSSTSMPSDGRDSTGSGTGNDDVSHTGSLISTERTQPPTLPSLRTSPDQIASHGQGTSGQSKQLRATPVNGSSPHENLNGGHRTRPLGRTARDSPHKRKRSIGSDEGPRKTPATRSPSSHDARLEPHVVERRYSSSASPRREHYGWTPTAYPPLLEENGEDTPSHSAGPWYAQPSHAPGPSYDDQHSASAVEANHLDTRLAEALQQENQRLDSTRAASMGGSIDDDDSHAHSNRGSDYGTGTPTSAVQVDPRKRKRVFSNRTKTGCMTCRRRKKKCDEQKPECSNCIRGGFVCEGYSSRIEWQKSSRDKPPVPLQAKDGDASPNHHPSPGLPNGIATHLNGGHSVKEQTPPAHRRPQTAQALPNGAARTVMVGDDHEGNGVTPSPREAPQRNSLPPIQDPSQPQEQLRMPPLHEVERSAGMDSVTPSSSRSHRTLSHTSRNDSPQTPEQAAQAQAQAQLALQHQASLRTWARSEKEKMLAGELYHPNSPELVYERERCKAALWRFNNSMNPNLGISRDERVRLFRDILQPHEGPPTTSSLSGPLKMGKVGENVVVEAPFNCDYGYNIDVGSEVLIGMNCTIMDTCSVTIGPRTVLGPNVSILTASVPTEAAVRKGSQGPMVGKAITIGEDCWIGAGAIILAGIYVGRGSTIGAGSVVTRDVPPLTKIAGNPARVLRVLCSGRPSDFFIPSAPGLPNIPGLPALPKLPEMNL